MTTEPSPPTRRKKGPADPTGPRHAADPEGWWLWAWVACGAVVCAVGVVWFLPDASIGDRLWGIAGVVAVAVGIFMGVVMHGFGAGSPRYRADVLELERLGDGEGFRATTQVTLVDGTRLQLPLEAEHKRPRSGASVVLCRGDDPLEPQDDPRTADNAALMHPLELYGWSACLVVLGGVGVALPFLPD